MKRDVPTEIKAFLSDERKMLMSGYKSIPTKIVGPHRQR